MTDNSGMCTIPSLYLETVGLPDWRIKQWLEPFDLHYMDVEEIFEAINDCLAVDGLNCKPVIVVSTSADGRWDVFTKDEFYEVCDVY